MKAEILTIGDELLRGEIVDSNKALLSQGLLSLELETRWQTSVCDDPEDMTDALRRAVSRAEVVLVSGGLGPTRDDLTAQVVAQAFSRELVLDQDALVTIESFFRRIGREMAEINAKQAYFPDGARVLPNPIGTAPGFALDVGESCVFCMPGVPRELARMLEEQVLPRLARRRATATGAAAQSRRAALLRTFGMGESNLDTALADIAMDGEVSLGFRTSFPDNVLRPVARAATPEQAEARLKAVCRAIRERLGALVYAEGEESMEAVVVRLLADAGLTLALAESCSGGLVSQKLTGVPGASAVFRGGLVAYANASKHQLLGVPEALLREHGAVSEAVVRAMAEAARDRFGSDIGVATTGISGPDGGSPDKPVGLVYLALARGDACHAERFVFPLDRLRHRQLVAQVALDWVRRSLLGEPLRGPSLMRKRTPAAGSSRGTDR